MFGQTKNEKLYEWKRKFKKLEGIMDELICETKESNSSECKNYGQKEAFNEINKDLEKLEELKNINSSIICTITRDMKVCERSKKCFITEDNFAEFRVNLAMKLEELLNQ